MCRSNNMKRWAQRKKINTNTNLERTWVSTEPKKYRTEKQALNSQKRAPTKRKPCRNKTITDMHNKRTPQRSVESVAASLANSKCRWRKATFKARTIQHYVLDKKRRKWVTHSYNEKASFETKALRNSCLKKKRIGHHTYHPRTLETQSSQELGAKREEKISSLLVALSTKAKTEQLRYERIESTIQDNETRGRQQCNYIHRKTKFHQYE